MKEIVKKYLKDAGFDIKAYKMDSKDENYVEIFFESYLAIDFIIEDIKKTKYDNILEIKKYSSKKIISAIITLK